MNNNGLPPIHPGEFLLETLRELDILPSQFARVIGVPATRVSQVLKGNRPITAELALRLGRALGQSPEYWLNLQMDYDLKVAAETLGSQLSAVDELALA